jgi:hypothetical protein
VSEARIVLRITRSQQMAILDALIEHMRCSDHTENFVNCSASPPTETTLGELLNLFSDTSEVELAGEARPGK